MEAFGGHEEENMVVIQPSASKFSQELKHQFDNNDKISLLINRYINRRILTAIKQYRSQITSIGYLVDDDLQAMIYDPSIPIKHKIRPAQTEFLLGRNASKFDQFYASTPPLAKVLAEKYSLKQTPLVLPPIEKLAPANTKPIDANRLYYFAKMHSHEHKFLFPIVQRVLEKSPKASFDVIAIGQWAKKWNSLDRVTVHPEMNVSSYCRFIEQLPAGGIFLLPLMNTKLNASRSDTKLFEAVKSGSIVIAANHPTYMNAPTTKLAENQDIWVSEILNKMQSSDLIHEHQTLRQYLSKRLISNEL
ncbi:MAG: hypothetical protein ABJ034_02900 [Hyphomicrobiales bacterium]